MRTVISTYPSRSPGSITLTILLSVSSVPLHHSPPLPTLADFSLFTHFSRSVVDAGTMVTKIFHPNISKAGEICVDTLKKAWTRNLGIADVLVVSLPDFEIRTRWILQLITYTVVPPCWL